MGKDANKWFEPERRLNWHATDFQKVRRQNALNARHKSLIQTAKALQALANVQKGRNPEVARKAQADATYFFVQHKKRQALKSNKTTRRK
jgi:hypothetical protein